MNWRIWLKGLIAAFISAAASSFSVVVADPDHFNPASPGGLHKLTIVVVLSGLTGAALYLKQSPVPNGTIGK